jgi:hypothetical protein
VTGILCAVRCLARCALRLWANLYLHGCLAGRRCIGGLVEPRVIDRRERWAGIGLALVKISSTSQRLDWRAVYSGDRSGKKNDIG